MVKRIASGILFEIDELDNGTFVPVGQIKTVTDASQSKDEVDMTCMVDTLDQLYPSPVLSLGDFSLDLFWDQEQTATGQDMLQTLVLSGAVLPMRITFPFTVTQTRTWDGWIKELGEASYEIKNAVERTVLIRAMTIPVDA